MHVINSQLSLGFVVCCAAVPCCVVLCSVTELCSRTGLSPGAVLELLAKYPALAAVDAAGTAPLVVEQHDVMCMRKLVCTGHVVAAHQLTGIVAGLTLVWRL